MELIKVEIYELYDKFKATIKSNNWKFSRTKEKS